MQTVLQAFLIHLHFEPNNGCNHDRHLLLKADYSGLLLERVVLDPIVQQVSIPAQAHPVLE